ncbi:MAG: flagellar basal-body rod protein FlgG [Clostridiales bacterium]|jgi:flagellar basal-body rod protein FlgG|nr:flagellar basal-body rod protein FlgG [Clostridiales bacterium]
MMRSLWTAASGMKAQLYNVDVVANNIANVNTVGYKRNRVEFHDLLYETTRRAYVMEDENRPVNLQVGHGVLPAATTKLFRTGSFERTDNYLDVAIQGDAFFVIRADNEGTQHYTRDGSFKLSLTDNGMMLTTSDGLPVLDDGGNEIYVNIDAPRLIIGTNGELSYTNDAGENEYLGYRIQLVKFQNRDGLEAIGDNFFVTTSASGEPQPDAEYGRPSQLRQGYVEMSNVNIADEMVNLIVAQRAYETNSKCITTSDDMLGIANSLKR